MIRIRNLIWDDWNVEHIKKHKTTTEEVEEACKSVIKALKTYKGRLLILGKTKKNRFLTIVLAPQEGNSYYPVTAREMGRKERRFLEK